MSRWIGILLLVVLCIGNTTCVTVRSVPDRSIKIPEDYLGVCPTIRLDRRELDLIESIGAKWIRHDFPWDTIENKRGEWDFGHWDRYVDRAKLRRRKVLAILDYDVPWIHEHNGPRPYIPPDKLPSFLTYVEKVVRRYGDTVAAFEVWNEPNARRFWKGSQKEFFHLVAEAVRTIKTNAPDAKVVGGAVLISSTAYLKDIFEAGVLNQVDVVSFHPYALHPDGVMRRIDAVCSIASEYGFTGELWITEIGFPGWNSGSRREIRQAEYAVKILLGAAIRGIRKIFWYELLDPGPAETAAGIWRIENHFGIARDYHSPKAAAHACSLVGRFVPGSRYSPDCLRIEAPLAGKIEVLPFVLPDGTTALFMWAKTRQSVRLSIDGRVKELLEHHMYTGEIRPFEQQGRVELTRNPRLLTFICRDGPATVRVSRVQGGLR
jgi:hypothetical protein